MIYESSDRAARGGSWTHAALVMIPVPQWRFRASFYYYNFGFRSVSTS